jgi:hypothetical protein
MAGNVPMEHLPFDGQENTPIEQETPTLPFVPGNAPIEHENASFVNQSTQDHSMDFEDWDLPHDILHLLDTMTIVKLEKLRIHPSTGFVLPIHYQLQDESIQKAFLPHSVSPILNSHKRSLLSC